MTLEEIQERHKQLHRAFDELLACWIESSDEASIWATIQEFMDWSSKQLRQPTCKGAKDCSHAVADRMKSSGT